MSNMEEDKSIDTTLYLLEIKNIEKPVSVLNINTEKVIKVSTYFIQY